METPPEKWWKHEGTTIPCFRGTPSPPSHRLHQTVHKESEVQGKGVNTSAFKRLSDLNLTTVWQKGIEVIHYFWNSRSDNKRDGSLKNSVRCHRKDEDEYTERPGCVTSSSIFGHLYSSWLVCLRLLSNRWVRDRSCFSINHLRSDHVHDVRLPRLLDPEGQLCVAFSVEI
jgi:hypothetical protein